MELSTDINYIAVILAAAANMAIGMFWYSQAGFGKQWMKLSGMKMPSKPEKNDMMPALIGSFVASLIMAYVLAHFISFLGLETALEGAELGMWVWLGFVGTVTLSDHLYSMKPLPLYYLNTGYRLVTFLVMGAIIASM